MESEFEGSWEAGQVPGWEDRGQGQLPTTSSSGIDLEAFDSVDELATIGKHPSMHCLLHTTVQASTQHPPRIPKTHVRVSASNFLSEVKNGCTIRGHGAVCSYT